MTQKVTLNEHLAMLDQNSIAGEKEIKNLYKRMSKKFKDCGYVKASRNEALVLEYIEMIFNAQGYRCTHWLPVQKGEFNGVWNRPSKGYSGWKTTQVLYEIDHVHPVNAGGRDSLTNFQFLSANANQFTKCSLTYGDLLRRVDLSDRLKNRIVSVLEERRKLFASKKWKGFLRRLKKCEKGA